MKKPSLTACFKKCCIRFSAKDLSSIPFLLNLSCSRIEIPLPYPKSKHFLGIRPID